MKFVFSRKICSTLQTVYDAANKAQKEDDLETAYLLFNKCITMLVFHRTNTNDFDEKYVRNMVGKLVSIAVSRCEELKETLRIE